MHQIVLAGNAETHPTASLVVGLIFVAAALGLLWLVFGRSR